MLLVQLPIAYAQEPPFQKGEKLTYQVYFFGLEAGTAVMEVDAQLHSCNGYSCYKVQVEGVSNKTASSLGFKIANKWESYLDVDGLRPHKFIAHIQENSYIREEELDFDYKKNQVKVTVAESNRNMVREVSYFSLDKGPMRDIISAYYALRSIDTSQLQPGDHLPLDFLLQDQVKLYANEGTLFLGKTTLTTKLGKIQTIVFAPVIPTKDTIFAGERPIEIFLSDDANKIPIKLNINFVVGSVKMELQRYEEIKEPLAFEKT